MADNASHPIKSPPPNEAAAADDAAFAQRLHVLEQLTSVYGFAASVAQQAVDAVGTDVTLCYNYILDEKLASDPGGPIVPISTCPHVASAVVSLAAHQLPADPRQTTCQYQHPGTTTASTSPGLKAAVDPDGTCPGTENWLCLTCGALCCSRYVNGHGVQHWHDTQAETPTTPHGHCVAVSLTDLSVWCHACRAYIVSTEPQLGSLLQELERRKFPSASPVTLPEATPRMPPPDERDSKRHKLTEGEDGMEEDSNEEGTGDRKLIAGASAIPKEPETMDPAASEDDEDEDRDEDENDQTGDEAEEGVDFEGDDDAFMQMVAEAAASHGIPLQWVLSHMHGEAVEDDGPVDYVFDSLPKSLSEVAAFIKSDKCQRILVLAGAGMSVASGIPDFRSADGLYATLNVNRLTCTSEGQRELIREDPSVALDQHLFLDNPLPCLESQREFILGTHARQWKTTLAHRFVELLHHKTGKLVRLYTQNIDGLEDQCANLPEEKVIAVHGSMDRAECARCETPDDFGRFCRKVREQIKDLTLQDEAAPDTSTPITCQTCGSPSVKPAIVLFRSSLPKLFFERVPEDVKDVDLLIVVGTSLKVAPANSLVRRVPRSAMRLLVNREVVGEHLGMSFGDEAERDVFAEGDIDPVLLDLVEELGWLDDLRSLLDEGALPSSSMDLLSARLEASTASPSDEQVSSAES